MTADFAPPRPTSVTVVIKRRSGGPPPRTAEQMAEAFWSRVARSPGCWLWTGARRPKGYGVVATPRGSSRPRMVGAHQMAWMLANGPIPMGMHVCHRCDNPPCVRPGHLFLGTPRDNVLDARRKGRLDHPCGERNPRARLCDASVRLIRARRDAGAAAKDLAAEYGVDPSTISRASRGQQWRHIV